MPPLNRGGEKIERRLLQKRSGRGRFGSKDMTCFRTDQNGDGCRVKTPLPMSQNLFVAPVEIYPPTVVGLPEGEPSVAQPATAITNRTNNRNFLIFFLTELLDVSGVTHFCKKRRTVSPIARAFSTLDFATQDLCVTAGNAQSRIGAVGCQLSILLEPHEGQRGRRPILTR